MTWKPSGFKWDPDQEKALHQVQTAVQAALPLGPYNSADPMGLEVSLADDVWSLWQSPLGESQCRLVGF